MEHYKALLVANGYTQISCLNFNDTFSSVVKSSKFGVVLSLAITTLDIKMPFFIAISLKKGIFINYRKHSMN